MVSPSICFHDAAAAVPVVQGTRHTEVLVALGCQQPCFVQLTSLTDWLGFCRNSADGVRQQDDLRSSRSPAISHQRQPLAGVRRQQAGPLLLVRNLLLLSLSPVGKPGAQRLKQPLASDAVSTINGFGAFCFQQALAAH